MSGVVCWLCNVELGAGEGESGCTGDQKMLQRCAWPFVSDPGENPSGNAASHADSAPIYADDGDIDGGNADMHADSRAMQIGNADVPCGQSFSVHKLWGRET